MIDIVVSPNKPCYPYLMDNSERLRRSHKIRWGNYRKRFPNVQLYLLSKSERHSNGCLRWKTGAEGRYPEANYDGVARAAHLMSYEAFNGPIPPGKIIRHTCDDQKCIEPSHLIPGTKKDNRRDFMERHPRAQELCLGAAHNGVLGVKRFWDNMSQKQREEFIRRRANIQKEKTTLESRQRGIEARREGLKRYWETRRK